MSDTISVYYLEIELPSPEDLEVRAKFAAWPTILPAWIEQHTFRGPTCWKIGVSGSPNSRASKLRRETRGRVAVVWARAFPWLDAERIEAAIIGHFESSRFELASDVPPFTGWTECFHRDVLPHGIDADGLPANARQQAANSDIPPQKP